MAEDDAPAGQPPQGEPGNVDAVDNRARFAEPGSSESAAAPPASVPAEADVAAASPKAEPGDPAAADTAAETDDAGPAADTAAEAADAAPTEDEAEPALEGKADAAPEAAVDKAAEGVEAATPEDAPDHQPADDAPLAEAAVEPQPEPAQTPPPARDPDPVRDPLVEVLQAELGDALVQSEIAAGELVVRVQPSAWRQAGELCRDRLGMDYFCFLSGLDWLHNPNLSAEKLWDPDETVAALEKPASYETGVAGGDTRFQVFARVYSTRRHVGLTLKVDLDEESPAVETWTAIYRGADWHERETWEMYGFDFVGHPDLRHMYLPGEFEGHPLRKDFPLLARDVKPWPGLVDVEPMPGEDEAEAADATAEGGD